MLRSATAVLLCIPIFSGCAVLTMDRPDGDPEFDLPGAWANAAKGNEGKISTGWVDGFDDRQTEKLVGEALANNHDLQAAAARLESAKQGAIIGRAGRFPTINFRGSSLRTRREELVTPPTPAPVTTTTTTTTPAATDGAGTGTGTDGGAVTTTTTTSTPAPTPPATIRQVRYDSEYGLSFDASWEMDLWGRLRDLDHAAYEDYLAAQADFRSARLSLAANTAKAWFDVITAQQQIELGVQTRDSFVANYRIIERNYKAGDDTASPLDVQLGRNNVAIAERDLVSRKLARDEAARPLEVLLGKYPSGKLKSGNRLPDLGGQVPAGLPSDLLWRRPDIVAAAASVRASAKRADAARKDLLPSFTLTGRASTSSVELNQMLLDPEEIVWSAAVSIAQTIFEGGANTAQAKRALAQNEEAIRSFASRVLEALREVESALATERSLAEQERFLDIELKQANLAERQASRDYSEGLVGILEVFEAQRRAFSARTSMIVLRNRRLQNRVDLHLALGGDFETLPEVEERN